MAIPVRRANPANIAAALRTFFVTSSIAGKRNLLQSDRSARLLLMCFITIVPSANSICTDLSSCLIIFHLLITVGPDMSIEHTLQLIKGGFAFRAGKEFGFKSPVWQKGFSEVRVYSADHFLRALDYTEQNPVRRGLVMSAAEFPYTSAHRGFELDDAPQGLKPSGVFQRAGTSEDVP